jgi:hypothetical protein
MQKYGGGSWFIIVPDIDLDLDNCSNIVVISVSTPKSASFSSESEFSGGGAAEAWNKRGQKTLFGRGANLFCIYPFQIFRYIC